VRFFKDALVRLGLSHALIGTVLGEM